MPFPSQQTLFLSACPLCERDDFQTVAERDRDRRPLRTVLCRSCGLVFTNPRPPPEEVASFYEASYRLLYKHSRSPSARHVYRAGQVALERLDRLRPLLAPHSRVLDLGSGAGELLYLLRAAGHAVSGIEPNLGYGDFAREDLGLPVQAGGYQTAQVQPGSQDMITVFHVLEHLEDPVAALRAMAFWLRSGGRLVVEVPNVMSTCQWPSSRFHLAHLLHFSPDTLAMAGRRASLSVLDCHTSRDGGNVICVFERLEGSVAVPDGSIPGHAAGVAVLLSGHTTLRHALTPAPYWRPLLKLRRRFRERRALAAAGGDVLRLLKVMAEQACRPSFEPRQAGSRGLPAPAA